jgi:hypothetical protein
LMSSPAGWLLCWTASFSSWQCETITSRLWGNSPTQASRGLLNWGWIRFLRIVGCPQSFFFGGTSVLTHVWLVFDLPCLKVRRVILATSCRDLPWRWHSPRYSPRGRGLLVLWQSHYESTATQAVLFHPISLRGTKEQRLTCRHGMLQAGWAQRLTFFWTWMSDRVAVPMKRHPVGGEFHVCSSFSPSQWPVIGQGETQTRAMQDFGFTVAFEFS